MNKDEIRRRIRARKQLLTDEERKSAALRVFERLEQLAVFAVSDRIMMYHSLPDELSTREFLLKWYGEKSFFLPRVNGVNLEVLPYERTSMKMGAFRIEEPSGNDITDPASMELIIVPAVAYDRNGNRVGRGKGYYDRLLSDTNAYTVGVAYDFQLLDEVESTEFDIPVDMIITESHTITIRKR